MSTTTIRIPETLRAQVKEAAERAGTTAHQFIIQAIAEKAEAETKRNDFLAVAEDRHARIIATGETIPWAEMRQYLEARAAGHVPKKPAPKKPSRRS